MHDNTINKTDLIDFIIQQYGFVGIESLIEQTSCRATSFTLESKQCRYLVKLLPHNDAQESSLKIIHRASAQTECIPIFLKPKDNTLFVVAGKSEKKAYALLLSVFVEGEHRELLTLSDFFTIGRSMHAMHQALNRHDYVDNHPSFLKIEQINNQKNILYQLHFVSKADCTFIEEQLNFHGKNVCRLLQSEQSICHGDMGLHNLLMIEDRCTFIDFDDICVAHKTFDLGCFLWGLIYKSVEKETGGPEQIKADLSSLMSGYASCNPNHPVELSTIQSFAVIRAIWHICYFEGEGHWIDKPLFDFHFKILTKLSKLF